MIQKLLGIAMLPLLLAASHLQLTEEDIQNNRNYFEVIDAATGKKEERTLYAEKPVIQTHIMAVSAIKKALTDEGIDPSNVKVLLYYQGLTISDDLVPIMWQNKPHPDTISSPWLDLTKTVNTAGETRITIRIDATASRLLSDVFFKPEDKSNISGFLEIPSIKESCFNRIFDKYERYAVSQALKISHCAPKELREPLISLFQSSYQHKNWLSNWLSNFDPFGQLFFYCQNSAEEYYTELYPRLAVRELQILESRSNSEPKWWTEIIDQVKPIQKCQK